MIEVARQRSLVSDWVTIKQAATILGVSVRTARRWQAAGKMPDRCKRSRQKMYLGAEIRVLKAAPTELAKP